MVLPQPLYTSTPEYEDVLLLKMIVSATVLVSTSMQGSGAVEKVIESHAP